MIALQFKGELDGITDLWFDDDAVNPFYFTFKVKCTKCGEAHSNAVKFQQHVKEDLPNSRGEANLVMKCKFCGTGQNLNVTADPKTRYTADSAGKPLTLALFDTRGVDLVEFLPEGPFKAKSLHNATVFDIEFDDGEWYDYDETAGSEVSITNTQWTISKVK